MKLVHGVVNEVYWFGIQCKSTPWIRTVGTKQRCPDTVQALETIQHFCHRIYMNCGRQQLKGPPLLSSVAVHVVCM